MEVTGLISALIIGLIIGAVARLIVPGKQNLPIWLTLVVGVVAALIGTAIAQFAGYAETPGIDWLELITQLVLAVIGVYLVAGLWGGRNRTRA
jgi:uncharacterized membrane protein YeaQ/YmgE (transglycosylase-associated protein family)